MGENEWKATTAFKTAELNPKVWKILTACFALLSLVFLITLIVVTSRGGTSSGKGSGSPDNVNGIETCAQGMKSSDKTPKSQGVFDDLSSDEISAVRDYMLAEASLNITPYDKASIDTNYIYLIQRQPPSKQSALDYLDSENGIKPEKEAIVTVFKGAAEPPIVEEYIVAPADKPTGHKLNTILGRKYPIRFNARPFDPDIEFREVDKFMKDITNTTYRLLKDSYDGYVYYNCTDRCLIHINNAPMGFTSEDRKSWFFLFRDTVGYFLQATNFEVYLDHGGSNTSSWKVLKVVYNSQSFDSAEQLMTAYDNGRVKKINIPAPKGRNASFSTYERRGTTQPSKPMRGPEMYEPDGKRYSVSGRHIEYMLWSFDFRVETTAGIQIFDIKFNKDRIVYELSLQEAISFYSGYSPGQSSNNFLDSNWRMGFSNYELVRGIDCPATATFFDHVHLIGFGGPKKVRNGVCVFELNTGMPLRRHYDNNFVDGYTFYGGMVKNALVLRSISTVYNYDYVLDYIFYQNGVIEVRVAATGYVLGTYYDSNVEQYAYQLNDFITSTVHNHMLNYKIDLDVGGRRNSYQEIEVGIENITHRWIPGRRRVQMVLKRDTKKTEQDAAYKFNFDTPKYLNFYNQDKKNKHGVNKGYRIQLDGISKQLYPADWYITPTASWSLYQLAVTKHKESEQRSSSLFNQNGATDPHVDFSQFIGNESIVKEDLVAWATIGMMHIPHSEDIPNTATAGTSASFYIRPFNYFDEDPSMGSTDAVLITPADKEASGQKIERHGTPDGPVCFPEKKPIDFYGRYE